MVKRVENSMKLAVVTGGARGIGLGLVNSLILAGYEVYFTYHTSDDKALEIMDTNPNKCKGFKVDSKNVEAIFQFADQVLQYKTPDILINNVGINDDKLLINQTFEEFKNIVDINFLSVVAFCKAFLNDMIENRIGNIINISSVAANKPKAGNSSYGASKLAIERFSKSLALEVARFKIKVNCVAPGFVHTNMFDDFIASQDKRAFYSQIPMRKILAINEVCDTVIALCNNTISTTGSVISLGNGENIV